MKFTNDQYLALNQLMTWYRKYSHQFFEISGIVGTGPMQVIREFIDMSPLDPREVMYLSHDQTQVLEMAYNGIHSYYTEAMLYKYYCVTDLSSLPVLGNRGTGVKSVWKRERRTKVDKKYKLIVVFDAMLMTFQNIKDLANLGLPVILMWDPMLLPIPDSYTFTRESIANLREINEDLGRSPIVYFAHRIIRGGKLDYGNYDNVAIVPKKQMNMYNLKSSEMNITVSEDLRHSINQIYREKIMGMKNTTNVVGERVIVTSSIYREKLKNSDNNKVKVYLRKGLVGTLTKVNKRAMGTRFINVNFRPEAYHEDFVDLSMDRYLLNEMPVDRSRQEVPEDPFEVEYAYALSASSARMSHWGKTTVILDDNDFNDELQLRQMYTAITRAKKSMTIVI